MSDLNDELPVEENLSLFGYFVKCLKNYAVFEGRARRKEFWGFYLFATIFSTMLGFVVGIAIGIISAITGIDRGILLLGWTVFLQLVIFVPCLSLLFRRLHDTGRSGLNILWNFTIIGMIPVWIWTWFCDSQPGTNSYGPSPKYPDMDD